ncbi:MAG: SUMF1/EgtB/PvdO family nonheme iron enzyme [Polyangiaceae bacterium]
MSASSAHAAPPPLDLGGGRQIAMVEVAAGTFAQGSAPDEPGHAADEGRRDVTLTRTYWISRAPVSAGQFRAFATDAGYVTEAEKGTSGGFGWDGTKLVQDKRYNWRSPGFPQTDDDPVVIVTFGDAQAFAGWVARKTGLAVRLPTEAEWERAARGGSRGRFFWGNDETQAEANAWFAKNAGAGTHPSGSKPQNDLGLVDAAGNVWQWCLDFHGPISGASATDPFQGTGVTWEHSDKPRRVLKGGSWLTNDRWKVRPAARNRATEGSRNSDFGFRIVAFPKGTTDPLGPAMSSPALAPSRSSGSSGSGSGSPTARATPPCSGAARSDASAPSASSPRSSSRFARSSGRPRAARPAALGRAGPQGRRRLLARRPHRRRAERRELQRAHHVGHARRPRRRLARPAGHLRLHRRAPHRRSHHRHARRRRRLCPASRARRPERELLEPARLAPPPSPRRHVGQLWLIELAQRVLAPLS